VNLLLVGYVEALPVRPKDTFRVWQKSLSSESRTAITCYFWSCYRQLARI